MNYVDTLIYRTFYRIKQRMVAESFSLSGFDFDERTRRETIRQPEEFSPAERDYEVFLALTHEYKAGTLDAAVDESGRLTWIPVDDKLPPVLFP